jgi:hypothetical protein
LSQYIGVGWERETLIYIGNQHNQTMFFIVNVIAWYHTSVEDWESINYFLPSQKIKESPKNIQKLVIDLQI